MSRLFLDLTDAAKLTGFSRRHFHRKVLRGEIPAKQFGDRKKFFILRADLEGLIREYEAKRTAEPIQ